jgi:hypothetical protein
MSKPKRVPLILAVLSLLAVSACGPIVMIPGGQLSGTPKPVPPNWSFSDSIDTVQLETRPDDPYSVNVWGVAAGPFFYLAAGNSESTWAQHIQSDPHVRLKLGDDIYQLVARAIDDPAEREVFLAALKRKYDFEPDPDERDAAMLFRLEARPQD